MKSKINEPDIKIEKISIGNGSFIDLTTNIQYKGNGDKFRLIEISKNELKSGK